MYNNRKTAAIIAAAGRGKRFGSPLPKQFLKVGGEHIIIKTLKAFDSLECIDYIFVVASEDYIDYCKDLVRSAGIRKVEAVVCGGEKRQDSVFNALQEVNRLKPGVSYVLIHDAARPFVSRDTILNVLRATDEKGAAVACVAMKDSVRRTNHGGGGSESVERSDYFSVQTPQGFRKSELIEAYEKAYDDGFRGTDDASIMERAGHKVEIVSGDYGNIKITTKEDLPIENRVGIGYDVHRLVEGRKLILGGVEIPHSKGLEGHSDADVLIHALIDALLGAAGLGDIGRHFPDSDERYRDVSSISLLKRVKAMLDENYYYVANVDATVIAQEPKVAAHVEEMKSNIAGVLKIDRNRVNIKGTTTERLGFTGRGEGIAAEATAAIYR